MNKDEQLKMVKTRLGILYDDEVKDAEIQALIDAATEYFNRAGWVEDPAGSLFCEAIVLYCKLSLDTEAKNITNHPVLISYIAQGRGYQDDS